MTDSDTKSYGKSIRLSEEVWKFIHDHAEQRDMTFKAAARDLVEKGKRFERQQDDVIGEAGDE